MRPNHIKADAIVITIVIAGKKFARIKMFVLQPHRALTNRAAEECRVVEQRSLNEPIVWFDAHIVASVEVGEEKPR